MRKLLLVFLPALLLAQSRIITPAWISGDGAAHQVSATDFGRWVTVFALPTNSATNCSTSDLSKCPVTGDSSIAIGARGIPLLPGSSYTYQVIPQPGYQLSQIYYSASTGDKVQILWGK